jgi:hypothetical protein
MKEQTCAIKESIGVVERIPCLFSPHPDPRLFALFCTVNVIKYHKRGYIILCHKGIFHMQLRLPSVKFEFVKRNIF